MIAAISLLALAGVIALAYFKKYNPGILGIAVAFLLGFFVKNDGGASLSSAAGACSVIMNAFPTSLFLRIMGVSMLFSIAQANGSLEYLTKVFLHLLCGKRKLIPWLFYALGVIGGVIGAGGVAMLLILMPIASGIVKTEKIDFMCTGLMLYIGISVGCIAPLSVNGLIIAANSARFGIDMGNHVLFSYGLCTTIIAAFYYFSLKGYRITNVPADKAGAAPKLNRIQALTLGAVAVFIALALAGFELAILSMALVAFLLIATGADEAKMVAGVPWKVLILMSGMSMLVTMVSAAGGIGLLVDFFRSFLSPVLVNPVMCVIGGLMGFVASSGGVVIPTLIPTIVPLCQSLGCSPVPTIVAMVMGAQATSLSPFAVGGAMVMGLGDPAATNVTKLFTQLMVFSLLQLLGYAAMSAFGLAGL